MAFSKSKGVDELVVLFSDLREKSLKRGETLEAVRLEFLQEVEKNSSSYFSKISEKRLWIFLILPVVVAAVFYYFDVVEWLKFREEPCLLNVNEIFIEVTRKETDCSLVCEGLTEVPRISGLSKEEFVTKYAYTGRPVVVIDAAKNWSATDVFNFTFFKDLFEKNKYAYRVNEEECQFFPYRTEFISLEQAFNMSKERSEWKGEPWYFGWSNCDTAIRRELRTHYQTPYFLPNQSETSEQDWIFMGGPGPGAQIHNLELAKRSCHIHYANTFRPDRLREIADRFNLDQNAMLDNVLYCRAYTSEHQYELMDCVAAKFHEEPGVFKLMIIDSIMALFRVDFCGRGELADRQQKLAQMLSRLQKLSEEFNVAVFITNQMTADPGATMSFQADPKKPIGGHILAHASTTRISLRKGRGETRIAKIYDSPDLPENEATFAVTTGGIADAKE